MNFLIRNRGFFQEIIMEGVGDGNGERGKNCLYRMCKGTLLTSLPGPLSRNPLF